MRLEDLIQKKDFMEELSTSIRHILFATFPHITAAEKEDIDQDVKLKLWKMIATGKKIINLRSYLWRVVYTTTLDVLNERMPWDNFETKRLEEMSGCPLCSTDPADPPDPETPESIMLKDEQAAIVREAIEALPMKRRIAVKMHFAGMSIEQTALFLEWSPNKVRHLLYRGLDDLKKRLKDNGGTGTPRSVSLRKEPV
jgi:RNA polymerase sigma-70 factor (ECF subfamily)